MNAPTDGPSARPLAGLIVAVTRPRTKGDRLAAELRRLGAEVVEAPAFHLTPPRDPGPLARAAARLADFDWVAVTSAAGIHALAAAAQAAGGGSPRRLAVVGSETSAAAAAAGWEVTMVPDRFDAEGLLEALDHTAVRLAGAHVLLPLAEGAREVLPEGLRARGARVERVAAYGSAPAAPADLEELSACLRDGRFRLLTFSSSSAARNLLAAVGERVLAVPVAAVGPVTAETSRELGYRVVTVAEEYTMDGLVQAVVTWWAAAR